ncbi:MAG: hypothetical protein SGPRY_007629, partial [Prymnesium sp.]
LSVTTQWQSDDRMQLQLMAMTCVVLMVQAMARVHRLGQSKTVHVYRLVSGGTAEERVVQRAQKKLYLSETVNRGVTNGGETTKLSGVELLSMIQFGAAAVFAGGNREPTDEELDAICDRSRKKEDGLGALNGGQQFSASTFDATIAPGEFKRQLAIEHFAFLNLDSASSTRHPA